MIIPSASHISIFYNLLSSLLLQTTVGILRQFPRPSSSSWVMSDWLPSEKQFSRGFVVEPKKKMTKRYYYYNIQHHVAGYCLLSSVYPTKNVYCFNELPCLSARLIVTLLFLSVIDNKLKRVAGLRGVTFGLLYKIMKQIGEKGLSEYSVYIFIHQQQCNVWMKDCRVSIANSSFGQGQQDTVIAATQHFITVS